MNNDVKSCGNIDGLVDLGANGQEEEGGEEEQAEDVGEEGGLGEQVDGTAAGDVRYMNIC